MRERDTLTRNYRIIGLTKANEVVIEVEGEVRNSHAGPAEWISPWLPARELAILRRGLTGSGYERPSPRGETVDDPTPHREGESDE